MDTTVLDELALVLKGGCCPSLTDLEARRWMLDEKAAVTVSNFTEAIEGRAASPHCRPLRRLRCQLPAPAGPFTRMLRSKVWRLNLTFNVDLCRTPYRE